MNSQHYTDLEKLFGLSIIVIGSFFDNDRIQKIKKIYFPYQCEFFGDEEDTKFQEEVKA